MHGWKLLEVMALLQTLQDKYFRTGSLWSLAGRKQNASAAERAIRRESVPEGFGNAFDA